MFVTSLGLKKTHQKHPVSAEFPNGWCREGWLDEGRGGKIGRQHLQRAHAPTAQEHYTTHAAALVFGASMVNDGLEAQTLWHYNETLRN